MQNIRFGLQPAVRGSQMKNVSLPDPRAARTMISEWKVDTAARQQASNKAIAAAWERAPWPESLLSYHVHASTDGTALMHYSQWCAGDEFESYAAHQRDPRIALVDAAVPGIERYGLGRFGLYRSHYIDKTITSKCIVAVRADAASPSLQQQWVDAVIAALIEDRVPGLRAAHFHLCDDGKRIFNYAEWESGEAHLQAMRGGKGISQTDSAAWREVQSMTGITQQGFKHYALPLQISAMTAGMQQGGEYVW